MPTLLSFDVETHLIRQGCVAPKLVCLSTAGSSGAMRQLYDAKDGLAWFQWAICDPDVTLVGHNVTFDLLVMCAEDERLVPHVFRAIDAGRVRCTMLRERLMDCALGQLMSGKAGAKRYTLEALAGRRLSMKLDKGEDSWRLRYAELDGIPISEWPERAVLYSKMDATVTLAIHEDQQRVANTDRAQPRWDAIPDEVALMRATWALALMSAWGVRTDPTRVASYKATLTHDLEAIALHARAAGLVREDGSRDEGAMKARLKAALEAQEKPVVMTAKRGVSIAGEYLAEAGKACDAWPACTFSKQTASGEWLKEPCIPSEDAPDGCEGDSLLVKMAEYDGFVKLLGTYVPKLELAAKHPLNPRYTSLLETGRTSASDNAQTPPRKGGVRGCFIPRPGWVYAGADYDGAEMRSWAQACLDLVGHSKLASLYQSNPDADPHATMGAILLGVTEEEFMARLKAGDPIAVEYRQHSKPADFGYPGLMSPKTLVAYAAGMGIKLTLARATQAHAAWKSAWPEWADYFQKVKTLAGGAFGSTGSIKQLRSGRIRGRVMATQVANGFFQSLTADGMKRALWYVSWECYIGTIYNDDSKPSPLAGCRPVMELHDEIIAEMLEAIAHLAAPRMAEVMIAGMSEFLPDVPVRASPVLSRRWVKGAKPKFNAAKQLIPFEDAMKGAA